MTIPSIKNITNNTNIGSNFVNKELGVNSQESNSQSNTFVLDTAATKHICCNTSYFNEFKTCNKLVSWGKAKQINIKGYGDILIKSIINNKIYKLKDCLYMPELGINLISQSQLSS